jgi:hypothetical protein
MMFRSTAAIVNLSLTIFPSCRSMLHAAVSLIPLLFITGGISTPPPAQAASNLYRVDIPAGDEIPPPIRSYFTEAVALMQSQLGSPDFKVRLALYGTTPNLPSGIPGDPAKDFQRNNNKVCGIFSPVQTPESLPYAFCPLPGVVPLDPNTRDCCRHFAYAVPYSKFGFAVEDRVTTIVVSPRLLMLEQKQWQAILAHELGHAVDFYLFGKRYRLANNQASIISAELKEELMAIDREEQDPEARADLFGETLVLKPREQKLCYDPVLKLQILVDPSVKCNGGGSEGSEELLRHYTHPPLAGGAPLRIS